MKRADFIFTIGFQGDTAVVDAKSRRRYRNCSLLELLEEGQYRAAIAGALFDADPDEQQKTVDWFRSHTPIEAESFAALKRLFGVFEPPGDNQAVPVHRL